MSDRDPDEEMNEPAPSENGDPFSDNGHTDAEEEDGEDLMENMEQDYRPMPEFDRYESDGLAEGADAGDDDDDPDARFRAEEALEARDRREGRTGVVTGLHRRLPGIFGADDEDDDERPRQRRRTAVDRAADGDLNTAFDDEDELAAGVNLDNFKGPLREHLAKDVVRTEVARRFKQFLKTFKKNNVYVYLEAIDIMCGLNKQSLYVSYLDLSAVESPLAIWVADAPADILPIFDQVAKEVVLEIFEAYDQIHHDVFVRIRGLPISDKIRDIRQSDLNVLIKISGVVTRRTGVFPQLQQVKYDCGKCGYILGPYYQNSESEVKVSACPNCQSKGPFSVNVEQTIYRNYQKLTLQESPGTVPAGRLPRHKEVIVTHDLIDCARPGEEIEVTGLYTNNFDASLNIKNGFPVFATVVEANYVSKAEDTYAAYNLTEEDKLEIQSMAKDPRIAEKIIQSIAPSIHGHEIVKTGLALSMFGGEEKFVKGQHHRLRGDINMLILGDPGVAKSQFLKYVEKTSQRAVYTTGKGASAVGLTAMVHKDPVTREWVLEGGALVLADKGVCLIDEFDKMNDQDRVSIHEAMEQQSISISKAGIVTSLQARCAVIAAANPVGGRYDMSRTFAENVELTEPILSRFDVLCVLKDKVDPVTDERLARFVVDSHYRSHPAVEVEAGAAEKGPIPQEKLRKYITYAKRYVKPKLNHADCDKVARLYADLRREFVVGNGVPIAVRHIESLIRMSEAHARMHLRDYVNDADVDIAIRTMLESFIGTQKYSVQRTLQRRFSKFLSYQRDYHALLLDALRSLVRDQLNYDELMGLRSATDPTAGTRVKCGLMEEKAKEYGISDCTAFYASDMFTNSGFELDTQAGVIVFTR